MLARKKYTGVWREWLTQTAREMKALLLLLLIRYTIRKVTKISICTSVSLEKGPKWK